jgi:hypothetical protein
MSSIIDILRNRLYSKPIQTLVQEYICNARDAMREANTWGIKSLVIGVPNAIKPVFSVRDFGVGLSPDRVENVFVLYGASTKRDSNNQTGGFGIGAKSAWSYTDSFTVTTFVDGIERVYIAHLGTNNMGSLDLISERATTEPNGTMVSIAVRPNDIQEFKTAIQRCTYFWKEPIEFLGSADNLEKFNTIYEDDDVIVVSHCPFIGWLTGLLIDGVIYPCEQDQKSTNRPALLKFKTGELDISASREEITKCQKNTEAIEAKLERINRLAEARRDELMKLKSLNDVIKFQEKWGFFTKVKETTIELDGYKYHYGSLYLSKNSTGYWLEYRRETRGIAYRQVKAIDINSEILVDDETIEVTDKARRLRNYLQTKARLVTVVREIPAPLAHRTFRKVSDLQFVSAKKRQVKSISPEHVQIRVGDNKTWHYSHWQKVTSPLDPSKQYCVARKGTISHENIKIIRDFGYELLQVTALGEKQIAKARLNTKPYYDVINKIAEDNKEELAKFDYPAIEKLSKVPSLANLLKPLMPKDRSERMDYARKNLDGFKCISDIREKLEKEFENITKQFPLIQSIFIHHLSNPEHINDLDLYIKAKQGVCKCK